MFTLPMNMVMTVVIVLSIRDGEVVVTPAWVLEVESSNPAQEPDICRLIVMGLLCI